MTLHSCKHSRPLGFSFSSLEVIVSLEDLMAGALFGINIENRDRKRIQLEPAAEVRGAEEGKPVFTRASALNHGQYIYSGFVPNSISR